MQIYPLRLTATDLARAPERERVFYLQVSLISNEVSILNKLAVLALKQPDGSQIKERAGSAVAMLMLRIMAGRIYEAHRFISANYYHIRSEYSAVISLKASDALTSINRYFGRKGNLVSAIRQKLAFHSDFEVLRRGLDHIEADDELVDYLAHENGNSLFWSGELLQLTSLRHLAGGAPMQQTYATLTGDLLGLGLQVNDFAVGFVNAFYKRHFPEALSKLGEEVIEINDAQPLLESRLDFFFDLPGSEPPH